MRDDDPVIAALAAADPHPGGADPVAGETELVHVCERIMATPAPRPHRHRRLSTGPLVAVASAIVALAVVVLFLHAGSLTQRASVSPAGTRGSRVVLRLEPSPAHQHITAAAEREEVTYLRARLRQSGTTGITVSPLGVDEVAVSVPSSVNAASLTRYLTAVPERAFTDWEANVIAPNGRTAASQLLSRDPAAQLLSQGTNRGPGSPGAGAVPLERAVGLAAHQPARPEAATLSRLGREWFAFARTGADGCHAATLSCYRAGPTASRRALRAERGDRVLAVPQGTVVVQATSSTGPGADYRDPAARFFVLRDDVAFAGAQITGASVSTSDGRAAVDVDLSRRGTGEFRNLTAKIARRGSRLALGEDPEFQHFAVVLGGSLLSVVSLDYRVYPDGIVTLNRTAEIDGGYSPAAARRIAAELRFSALPLNLKVVSRG